MKAVIWTDERGYRRRSLLRNTDPDNLAPMGIPSGPPDLDLIDWDELKREINQTLVDTGIFTWGDVQRNGNTALAHAQSALKRRLIALYRDQDTNATGS